MFTGGQCAGLCQGPEDTDAPSRQREQQAHRPWGQDTLPSPLEVDQWTDPSKPKPHACSPGISSSSPAGPGESPNCPQPPVPRLQPPSLPPAHICSLYALSSTLVQIPSRDICLLNTYYVLATAARGEQDRHHPAPQGDRLAGETESRWVIPGGR